MRRLNDSIMRGLFTFVWHGIIPNEVGFGRSK